MTCYLLFSSCLRFNTLKKKTHYSNKLQFLCCVKCHLALKWIMTKFKVLSKPKLWKIWMHGVNNVKSVTFYWISHECVKMMYWLFAILHVMSSCSGLHAFNPTLQQTDYNTWHFHGEPYTLARKFDFHAILLVLKFATCSIEEIGTNGMKTALILHVKITTLVNKFY